jgi:hypothetical protein
MVGVLAGVYREEGRAHQGGLRGGGEILELEVVQSDIRDA